MEVSMVEKYSFPINNADEYPGRISFRAVREDNQTFLSNLYNQAANAAVAEVGQAALDAFGGTGPDVTPSRGQVPALEHRGTVSLYLPASLQFTDGIDYANVDLGARGAAAENALASGGGISGIAGAAIEGMLGINSINDLIQQGLGSQAGQLALTRTIGKLGEDVRGAVESTTGIALNPNKRSLLRGANIRRFRFTFKLIPTSQKESDAIKNIIKFFRTEMYPSDIPAANVTVGMEYPSKFNISMSYRGRSVATGILPCFLENFDTNYNPNTMGMMRDGNFPEVDISMSFMEHRALRRKDILAGY